MGGCGAVSLALIIKTKRSQLVFNSFYKLHNPAYMAPHLMHM